MERDEMIARLREIAACDDDWFGLHELEEERFLIEDNAGSVATIVVEERWAEIRAGRSVDAAPRLLAGTGSVGSLIRVSVEGGAAPIVIVRGRLYLDGASIQALFVLAREVLMLAGPLSASIAVDAGAESQAEIATEYKPPEQPAAGDTSDAAAVAVASTSGEQEPPGAAAAGVPAEVITSQPNDETVMQTPHEPPPAPALPPDMEATVIVTPEAAAARDMDATQPPTSAGAPASSTVGATVQIRRGAPAEVVPEAPPLPAQTPADESSTRPCRRCGDQVKIGERFCINCGAPQPGAAAADDPPPSPLRRSTEPDTVVWRRPPGGPEETPLSQSQGTPSTTCARCGVANPTGNRFCQGCGSPLAP